MENNISDEEIIRLLKCHIIYRIEWGHKRYGWKINTRRGSFYGVFDGKTKNLNEALTIAMNKYPMKSKRLHLYKNLKFKKIQDGTPVNILCLSARPRNCLISGHINYIEELTQCTENGLRDIVSMGSKSIKEIKHALAERGLSLKE